jgi:hypothetical protein
MVNPLGEAPQSGNNPAATRCDITVADSASNIPTTPFTWQREVEGKHCPNLKKLCQNDYTFDKMFQKILEHPEDHKSFEVKDGLIYYLPKSEIRTLCIPHSEFRGRKVTELVIDQVHRIVGHMGSSITGNYA